MKKPAKKSEFSKWLARWAATVATIAAAASYILSAFGLDPVSDLTSTIFTACIGYLITYAAKSLGEKVARDHYGLDVDGNPLRTETPGKIEEITNEEEAKG